ncbi:hypothetical protein PT974_06267 [Cladobotryum mycophilum]|uniref:Uncharacterized protein n=1 Tax=Cladobotryum mycophilum TaxID=491253 RepID=A0ABR0SL23_9HYPO
MPPTEASNNRPQFSVPQVSQDELFAFHQKHFSTGALADFGQDFMNPTAAHESHAAPSYDEWDEEEEDDGLGYYKDGVKRTLTDAQIEIFRHSELRELRRAQEKLAQAKTTVSSDASADDAKKSSPQIQGPGVASDFRSKKKKKKKNPPKKEPKPDLRKRTWDVVEAGLDSLDYD